MRRFRLTPEVAIKSISAFIFGAVVGFLSFKLVNHFSSNQVSAKEETQETQNSFEKTQFPLKIEEQDGKKQLNNNNEAVNVILRNYPRIVVQKKEPEPEPEAKKEQPTEPEPEIEEPELEPEIPIETEK